MPAMSILESKIELGNLVVFSLVAVCPYAVSKKEFLWLEVPDSEVTIRRFLVK